MSARANKFTLTQKKYVLYTDFGTNLDKNPFTGFLSKLENEDAVKQSLRNLLTTEPGERFYDADKGSPLPELLFETVTVTDQQLIRMKIIDLCNRYEPRVTIEDVIFVDFDKTIDSNEVKLSIVFSIQNILDQTFDLEFVVKRVR